VEAWDYFILRQDTLKNTTQVDLTDTTLVTSKYLDSFTTEESDPIWVSDSVWYADKAWVNSQNFHQLMTLDSVDRVFKISLTDGNSIKFRDTNPWTEGTSGSIYYDDGNVGIGTSSPDNKLVVSDSISGYTMLIEQKKENSSGLLIDINTSSNIYKGLSIQRNGTELFGVLGNSALILKEIYTSTTGFIYTTSGKIYYQSSGNTYDLTEGGTGSGASNFLELTDSPSSYSSQAGKYVRVNSSANGLEFATGTSGSSLWDETTYGIKYSDGNVGIKTDPSSSIGLYLNNSWSGAAFAAYNTNTSGRAAIISGNSTSISYPILQIDKGSTTQLSFIGDGSFYQRTFSGTLGTVPSNFGQWYVSGGKPYFRYGTTSYDLTAAGAGGGISEVSSATTNQLTVANGTTTPALSIVTGAVTNGSTSLPTGDHVYDFVTGLGYLTSVDISDINATGTPSSSTYLRGDGTWTTVSSGGSYSFINSLSESSYSVDLVGDVDDPGNSYYYGTNTSGTKGWYSLPNGVTNLSYTTGTSSGTVVSSTGSNATIPAGSTSYASLMLPGDKTKLNGIAVGADDYDYWGLQMNGVLQDNIYSTDQVNFAAGSNVTLGYTDLTNTITINATGGTTMTYPSAGIPISTGSAWGTSIIDSSAYWGNAYRKKPDSLSVSGTNTKTITLFQQDGSTITGNFTDMVGDAGTGDDWGDQTVNRDSTLIGNGATVNLGVDTTNYVSSKTEALKWSGTATGLNAALGRTSLGGTPIG